MHLDTKTILKSNRNNTPKQAFNSVSINKKKLNIDDKLGEKML